MATEANIQESVCLKKGEREDTSEIFEEKITELPGNQVKQLETSSHVAETVNTPLVIGKPMNESGIFFQALSVTMVIADEHSNTPEGFKAAKQTEPDEEIIENEEKTTESVTSSQDAACEDIKGTVTEEHATIVADFKEQNLNETPREFVKEETEGKSLDAQEATEQCENGTKDINEKKSEESVDKIEQDEEIKPGVKLEEKREQNELLQAITSDAAISTQTKSTEHEEEDTQKEVCEHEAVKESIEEEANVGDSTLVKQSIIIDKPDDEKAIEKEVCEESGPEKAEPEISDSTIQKEQFDNNGVTSSQESPYVHAEETTTVQHITTAVDFKEQDQDEKPKEFIKEDTEGKSFDAPEASKECVKEAIEQNPEERVKKTEKEEEIMPGVGTEEKKEQDELLPTITTDVCISTQTKSQVETTEHEEKEQDVNVLENIQNEDDVTHAQEVTFEGGLQEKNHHNEHEVVKSNESIEEEAETTLVKESIKIEERDDEKAIDKDISENSDIMPPSQKEQGDSDGVTSLQESPSVDVEETIAVQHVTTAVDFKERDLSEKPTEIIKEEIEDKSLDAPKAIEECEKGEKEEIDQNPEESVIKIEKEEETEEIKPGVEIEEKKEQDELLPVIDSDVCISTQTKSQVEETEHEEDIQNDDDLKDSPAIKEVCEEAGTEKDENEKEVKHSAIATVTEDEENEQEVNVLETDEGKNEVTSAQDVTYEKNLQEDRIEKDEVVTAEKNKEKDTEVIKSSEKTEQQMVINDIPSAVCISTQTEAVEETTEKNDEETTESGQSLSATQREIVIEEAKNKSVDAQEVTEQYDDEVNDTREQKIEKCVNETAHSTNEQEEHTDEIKPRVEATEEKDVCISTQTESQEMVTKNEEIAIESDGDQKEKSDNPVVNEVCEENNLKQTEAKDEETIEIDDGQKEKPENPLVDEVCEATSPKMAESEEWVKHSDSFDTPLNVDETLSKEDKLKKEDEIKTSEVQVGADDVTSSQHASNEDIKETTIGQYDTTVAYVEEGQGVSTLPKEILVEEAKDKSIDAEEMSLKLGQPNEQNVEETDSCLNENISQDPEDEIKKEDKDLSHESVENINDDTTKEEKCTLEQEVSKEIVTDLNKTTEVDPQEDITPSTSFETSTEDASNSEKEKAESEKLPIEDLETVSEVQIPELVHKSEDSMLKEESFISGTEARLDEEKENKKEVSYDEKSEVQGGGDDVTSSQNAPNEDIQETTIDQHNTTVTYVEEEQGVSATPKEILIEETAHKSIDVEETSLKIGQPNEQNVEETISQNPKDEIKNRDLSHESVEDTEEKCAVEHEPVEENSGLDEVSKENITESNETTQVEPQEDTLKSEKGKAETENFPLDDLETDSKVEIPELVPKPEEPVLKEEGFISETETQLDEEKRTVTEEISSDEKTEQITEIKQETVKEVCEEPSSKKVELEEGLINEKEITFKEEEKGQEVNMSTESQGEDNITSSQIEVSEEKEDLQEKYSHNEDKEHVITTSSSTQIEPDAETIENGEKNDEKAIGNDENEIVSKDANLEKKQEDESVIAQKETEQHDDDEDNGEGEQKPEEHTEEIKPIVETNEEKDLCISAQNESQEEPRKNEENAIEHDGDQKEKPDNLFVKEICEDSDLTKTESEEIQLSDDSDVKTREIVDQNTEETKFTDAGSSAQTENIEKTIVSEENNDEGTIEHDDGQTDKPESLLDEVVCEATNSEIAESEEGVEHSESFSATLNENETLSKEEKLEKEDEIKTSEVQGDEDKVKGSQNASSEEIKETTIGQHDTTVAHVEEEQCVSEMPTEIVIEEAEDKFIDAEEISSELGQPNEQNVQETHPCLSESISENPEDEIKKENKDLSLESVEDINDDTNKEEKCDSEHEPFEEHIGLDEVSQENVTDLKDTTEVQLQEDITPSIPLETSTEDTSNLEKAKAEDLVTVSEEQSPELVAKSDESMMTEETETETHLDKVKEISSDEKTQQTTEIKQETVKEVCEETSSEKVEFEEGVKLSDTSIVKINEKEITSFKDDDQENDQEVNMSAESQGKDNITSTQNEEFEEKEDLQEKIDHDEDNEGDFIKSREGVHEDTEEIKYSIETEENAEHVITTTSSTQIEPDEETVEKNEEKAIEDDKNDITSTKKDLEKKLEDVCSSAQTEPKEETVENRETLSELQGGVDDVVSSQNASNEDTTETPICQHATTTVQGMGVNAVTKEIIEEEVESKSIHAEEAGEQCENEAKDKIEQQPEECVNKPVNSCSETIEESAKEEEAEDAGNNKEIESKLEAENQADRTEDRTEIKDEVVLTEKVSEEQHVEEIETCITETISEKTEDKITKDEDLPHDSIEHINENITKEIDISMLEHEPIEEQNDSQDEVSKERLTDLNETIAVEPQEDITPSSSLETSTEDTTNSDKKEAVNEHLPIQELESVSEVHIPEVMPKSEDLKTKEECHVSETEIGTVTKEISSCENLETHGSTQQPDNSYSPTEENVTQSEVQLNSTEDCSEMVKDVILTEEIEQVPSEIHKEKEINDFKDQIVEEDSYSPELEEKSAENQKEVVHQISNSDSIPAENPEVAEVGVDGHIGQDLQGKEDISCVSKVTNDVDQKPKEEGISFLEDAATVESQVDLSKIESTAYSSEGEKLATQALESDCDVQIPELVAASEDSKVKEDGSNVEEQDTNTKESSSVPDKKHEDVMEAPTKIDEAKSTDLIIEEKALTEENLEMHEELKPTSEPVIDEDQVTIETKSQPEQSDITCESITNDQTSEFKLKEDVVTLAPENEIKSIDSQNKTTKNIIFTDEVAVETEKKTERNEIEAQVSQEDNCPTVLDNTSAPDQKELVNEIEYSKPVPVENTEVTEVKAESQIVDNIQAAEDLSSSKASSITETSKVEIIGEVNNDSINESSKDTIVPVLEDSKASELQFTDREVLQEKNGEKCIKEETQGNFGVEIKDAKSGNEAVENVIINEALLEDEKTKESIIIKDIINEETKLTQLTSDTDEVCQIEKSSSTPDELLEAKDSVKDTKDLKFIADNLNVKDETLTVIKRSYEDSEIVASEIKKLEDTVTDKEKETLEEPQADDDSILSSTKPTEDSEIATEIVPEDREVSAISTDSLPEASPDMLLEKHEDMITEDPKVLPSVEKDVIDVQKHEKDLDHESELQIADVVTDVTCSDIEPPRHLDTKEATVKFNSQENHKEQKKKADEGIEAVLPVTDVITLTREVEIGSVNLEVPSIMDATADKANNKTAEVQLESTRDQSKPTEEGSGIKQEPLEFDAPKSLGTAATDDLNISPKYVTDDIIKVSQAHPEIQNYEVPKESTKNKILNEKIDSPHEQEEPVAKPLIPEAANLKPDTTSVFIDQKEKSESAEPAKIVLHEPAKDQQVEKEETGVKTDEEYEEEEEDNEDDEKLGSCSDAPVMVEASKDMEVKAHKKSHNILSGVGSKVKHSIAKVKKAITGKSSPPKSPSPIK